MTAATPERDLADVASPALATAATAALVTLLLMQPPLSPAPQMAAPKPTQVALSVVEETPPATTAAGSHPRARAAPTASASESGGLALAAATASEAAPRGST